MLYLRSFNRFILISLALLGLSVSSASAAVVWNFNNGTLFGAENIDVGGTFYDVEFVDGSCIDLFSGCDEVSDFDFATRAEAVVASQALLDQVFVDDSGAPALFDTIPYLTNGCLSFWNQVGGAGGGSNDDCGIATPTIDSFPFPAQTNGTSYANNHMTEFFDGIGNLGLQEIGDISGDSFSPSKLTYAKWSPSSPPSAVPVPAAVWLFGTALVGLIGFGKHKSRAAV